MDEEAGESCNRRGARVPVLREGEESWTIVQEEMPAQMHKRMQVIQKLMAAEGTESYREVQQWAARQLDMSVRSVQRLVKKWREQGLQGLWKQERSDCGVLKTSQEWQKFIVRTYQQGNSGSRRMSRAQVWVRVKARAAEKGIESYPSRTTVYRILQPWMESKKRQKRSLGWRGERLVLKTQEGLEIPIEWSNQVWQCDHTKIDLLVVGQDGENLGRPWLTIIVDTYSRCLMGMHLGFDAPSAAVVCLALRHAILPKQYSSSYQLQETWDTYGLPQYLYTDGGKDFRSQHLEQAATELGIVLCQRRRPSDGGIIERPFGTLNQEFFSSLPGYVGSNSQQRSPEAEVEAVLSLLELEQMLVRYIVDRYNQGIDARMADQSRMGRWEAGRMAQLPLLGERELDLCLMRRDRRMVYRSGYIQFANLSYRGEHLAGYAGESVVVRYDPRDITTVLIYQVQGSKEVFVTRAHAQGWETETLSYAEAQALSRRRLQGGKALGNRAMLEEVRDRDERLKKLHKQHKQKHRASTNPNTTKLDKPASPLPTVTNPPATEPIAPLEPETTKPKKPVPFVRVYDYEELKREAGLL